MLRSFAIPLLLLTAAAVAAVSLYASLRVAESAGRTEIDARAARAAAGESAREVERLRSELAKEAAARVRLERDLASSLEANRALGEAVAATTEAQEQAAVQAASSRAMAETPPPFGVERCLLALRDCLRADGFASLHPLRARALVDRELQDVEFLDVAAGREMATVLVAEAMTAALHRATGEVELRFHRGTLRRGGVRLDFPPEGHVIRISPVVGRLWEQRLPYLLVVDGEYAADDPSRDRPPPRADAVTRALWLDRFDALLAEAGADVTLRVSGFEDLRDGEFRGAHVVGYDRGNLLCLTADCDRLVVEVDAKARIVSLLMRGGTLRRQGTESSIHAEGYRMLLPNLTPERATTIMTGMVVAK